MIYIIDSSWAPATRASWYHEEDEFISDILITTGSKDSLGFIGGKGRNCEKKKDIKHA
jgi:hypothetical protein